MKQTLAGIESTPLYFVKIYETWQIAIDVNETCFTTFFFQIDFFEIVSRAKNVRILN